MKKALAIVITCIFALALITACGGNGDTPAATTATNPSATNDAPAAAALSGNVLLNGSTSVERVIASLIEAFNMDHPGVTLTFNPTGSGAGITSAIEGTADIGLSSRNLRDTETGVDSTVFAIDGIALFVHPDNPVNDLTVEQIAAIYTGEISNWSEVGGNDAPIAVFGREAGSGTRDAFDSIMGLGDDVIHDQELTSGGALLSAVATNPFGIGYASLSAVGTNVQLISVNGVPCTVETLLDGTYEVQRPFIMMTTSGADISPATQAFIDFIRSPEATEIIYNAGVLQAS